MGLPTNREATTSPTAASSGVVTNPPTDFVDAYFRCDKPGEQLIVEAFTAGERRGIERCIEAVKAARLCRTHTFELGLLEAQAQLESLRDAPAGEQHPDGEELTCDFCGNAELPPFATGDRCPMCSTGKLLESPEPPAKPEAAVEEPALDDGWRILLSNKIAPHKRAAFLNELAEDWGLIGRPAPTAKEGELTLSERAAEEEVIRSFFYESGASYVIDTTPWTSEERLCCLNSAVDTFRKYRNERQALLNDVQAWQNRAWDNGYDRQAGLAGQLVAVRKEVRELKEERDQLRARVAELEKAAAKG